MLNPKIDKAYEILRDYTGENGYIAILKKSVYTHKNTLNDFQIEFILDNYNFKPVFIGKIVKLAQWFGKKKQEEYGFEFTPTKLEMGYYMGQAMGMYVFYARYRQSQEKGFLTICTKDAILTDFLTPDFRNIQIDFSIYNSMAKDGKTLRPHQEEAVKFMIARKKCVLADEPGSGKTKAATIASLVGGFKKILVICPASVKPTWRREISAYVPEDEITIIEGFNGMKKEELEAFLGYEPGKSGLKKEELLREAKDKGKWNDNGKYTIVNYDILNEFYEIPKETKTFTEKAADENGNVYNVVKQKVVKSRKKDVVLKAMNNSDLFLSQFDLIIIDEAHRLSNMTSDRYKIISDFVKRSNPKAIFCLTGTPITNNPYNFYNILKIIDSPVVSNWQKYVEDYCDGKKVFVKGEKYKWTQVFLKKNGISSWYDLSFQQREELDKFLDKNAKSIWVHSGSSNLDELNERVKTCYLRREQKDFGKIVQKTVKLLEYELTKEQRIGYEEEYNAFVERQKGAGNGSVTFMIEGVAMRQWLAREMIPYTKRIVDRHLANGEKVIVFCCFDNELYALKEIYKDCCTIFNGKLSPKDKIKAEKDFMEDPDCKVMIANITACGVGLTLTSANICVFNNFSWQSGENEQAEDRIYRLSQKRDVLIYYQLFKGTFFERMFERVKAKEDVIKQIIINEKEK